VEELGTGEILLTSKDADGTEEGYDLEMTKAVAEAVSIPVTASGMEPANWSTATMPLPPAKRQPFLPLQSFTLGKYQ
jgi:hypothetical protein